MAKLMNTQNMVIGLVVLLVVLGGLYLLKMRVEVEDAPPEVQPGERGIPRGFPRAEGRGLVEVPDLGLEASDFKA